MGNKLQVAHPTAIRFIIMFVVYIVDTASVAVKQNFRKK
jgi:hypothetical protein